MRFLARDDRPGFPAYSTHDSIGAAADATVPMICAWCGSYFGDVLDPPVTPIVSLVHPSPDLGDVAYVTLVHLGCVDGMTNRIADGAAGLRHPFVPADPTLASCTSCGRPFTAAAGHFDGSIPVPLDH